MGPSKLRNVYRDSAGPIRGCARVTGNPEVINLFLDRYRQTRLWSLMDPVPDCRPAGSNSWTRFTWLGVAKLPISRSCSTRCCVDPLRPPGLSETDPTTG